jgi:hypothetical protein
MRLGLYFFCQPKDTDAVWYHVGIRDAHGNIRKPSNSEVTKLQFQRDKIEVMALTVLKCDFIRSGFDLDTGQIELCFTKGISARSKRFDFRAFCGWVELSMM